MHACMHACLDACMHLCPYEKSRYVLAFVCVHAHVCTHMHKLSTYIHKYIVCTHMYMHKHKARPYNTTR